VQDLGAGWRFHLEVAPDHVVKLVNAVDDGQIQLRDEVGRKHDPVMAVDDEWLHGASSREARLLDCFMSTISG
jgi:hypothetical protein